MSTGERVHLGGLLEETVRVGEVGLRCPGRLEEGAQERACGTSSGNMLSPTCRLRRYVGTFHGSTRQAGGEVRREHQSPLHCDGRPASERTEGRAGRGQGAEVCAAGARGPKAAMCLRPGWGGGPCIAQRVWAPSPLPGRSGARMTLLASQPLCPSQSQGPTHGVRRNGRVL